MTFNKVITCLIFLSMVGSCSYGIVQEQKNFEQLGVFLFFVLFVLNPFEENR